MLQKPAPAIDRFVSIAFPNSSFFGFGLNFTDGATHQLAVYFLDWQNSGIVETITVRDAATQAVLDSRTIQNLYNGEYLVWTISGNVSIQFQGLNGDAFFSGWFFDPPTVTVNPLTTTLSPGQ